MTETSQGNPFVGPRPIVQGEPLFGRDVETRALHARLQARRIVVLHSPSGAGKSSLVQAGLIPRLLQGGFDVWRPIRVNLDPRTLADVPRGTNRYLLSAKLSLEEELPEDHRRRPAELAEGSLLDYLESRPRRKGRSGRAVVLLFDQFEEVLTVDPLAVDAKRAFFDEVGEALDTGSFWALFIIREDYLAALAPYRDRIPTQLSNTFRLDLLGLEGATEAARRLAELGGRAFPAASALIEDLSVMQVQQPDGSFVAQPGLHVEPVHLQVVCRRLWDAMPDDDRSIDDEHIERYADVSSALAGYYADAVAGIADGDQTVERALREWVGTQLIVGDIRSQVRQEKDRSSGLDNALIDGLRHSYIVRVEQRAGANWFELGHDRLVEPIQLDNEAWEREHLHSMQVQAKLWEQGRRAPALLLGAEALPDAERWATSHAQLLTEGEQEFLEQSHARRAEEARRRRMQKSITVATAIVAVVMAGLGLYALQLRGEAEELAAEAQQERNEAKAAEATAKVAEAAAHQAREEAADQAERSRLASLLSGANDLLAHNHGADASLLLAEAEDPASVPGWVQAANAVLLREFPVSTRTHHGAVSSARWSPDGTRFLTASADRTARIWNTDGSDDPIVLRGHEGGLVSARWSPDGTRVLTASVDGTARIWSADGSGEPIVLGHFGAALNSARWSPRGRQVVTASTDGIVRSWSADGSGEPTVLHEGDSARVTAVWSPGGTQLVTSEVGRIPNLWDETIQSELNVLGIDLEVTVWGPDDLHRVVLANTKTVDVLDAEGSRVTRLKGHELPVLSASFSPDGRRIATASQDRTIRIWNTDGTGDPVVLEGHDTAVLGAVWSPDSRRIISVCLDSTPRVWNTDGSGQAVLLEGHEGLVTIAHWSPDGALILTGSADDNTARTWDLDGRSRVVLIDHGDPARTAQWSPDGEHVLTRSLLGVRLWSSRRSGAPVPLADGKVLATSSDWSPDGERIVTGSKDGPIRVWSGDGKRVLLTLEGHRKKSRVTFGPRGERIVSASDDGTVRIWNADGSGEPIVLDHGDIIVRFAGLDPSGQHLLTRTDDGTVRLWSADGAGEPRVFSPPRGPLSFADFSPDGRHLLIAGDYEVRVFPADGQGEPVALRHDSLVKFAVWSLDGSLVFTAADDKTGHLWTPEGERRTFDLPPRGTIASAHFRPDGSALAVAAGDLTTIVSLTDPWDPIVLRDQRAALHSLVAWSPDGSRVFTASDDGTARIRTIELRLEELEIAIDDVTTSCLSPDHRETYLAETGAEARERYEACERSHGRTPVLDEEHEPNTPPPPPKSSRSP